MNWINFSGCRWQAIALCSLIFLTGCATSNRAIIEAERDKAKADVVREVITIAKQWPDLPPDCRKHERTGVKLHDRLDVAARKGDAAVTRGNNRITRCARWYDRQAAQ